MKNVVFVTGNQHKIEYLEKYLGHSIEHAKLDLDEIQSLALEEVIRHKVRQAYAMIKRPVLVEDGSFEFIALGRLPGPFIKWFLDELSFSTICSLLDGRDRRAIARCIFGYYDGAEEVYFEGKLCGTISEQPRGSGGFGYDPIFIPDGYDITRAEMNEEDDRKTYTTIKPFTQVKEFLMAKE